MVLASMNTPWGSFKVQGVQGFKFLEWRNRTSGQELIIVVKGILLQLGS